MKTYRNVILLFVFLSPVALATNTSDETITINKHQLDKLISDRIDALIEQRFQAYFTKLYKKQSDTDINVQNEQEAYASANKINTIDALEQFLAQYPRGMFADIAQRDLESLAYQQASKQNSIEAFTDFLNKYPVSQHAESAMYYQAKLKNTTHAYNVYLLNYPQGKHRRNALFNRAKSMDSVEEYNKVLNNEWRNNSHLIYYRDKAALRDAQKIGTRKAFADFISQYPNSAWIDQAKYFYKHGYDQH